MTVLGLLLLLSGWLLVLAALILLNAELSRNVFVIAGAAVEALGLAVMARSQMASRVDKS